MRSSFTHKESQPEFRRENASEASPMGDFGLRIVVNPTVLERRRTEDEKHLIEMEKRYFGKLSFRADV
jgi:hypothetical protein